MKYRNLINIIEEIAPPHLAESWDNSGVQINTGKEEINSVIVCLEINDAVIDEAKQLGCDLIITHHPLIFTPLKSVDFDSAEGMQVAGRYVNRLIKADICVYSAHLSFDNAPHGNNYYMGKLLKLTNGMRPMNNSENIPGIVGDLPGEMTLDEAAAYVEQALNLPKHYLKIIGNLNGTVKRVGLCTGAGGDFMSLAVRDGCDLFITGDVKFHEAQLAKALGLSVIDAGHYGTEKIFAENFAKQLKARGDKNLLIKETSANTNPYVV